MPRRSLWRRLLSPQLPVTMTQRSTIMKIHGDRRQEPGSHLRHGHGVQVKKGDTDNANQMFGQVIMNFADSEFAEKAKTERGY